MQMERDSNPWIFRPIALAVRPLNLLSIHLWDISETRTHTIIALQAIPLANLGMMSYSSWKDSNLYWIGLKPSASANWATWGLCTCGEIRTLTVIGSKPIASTSWATQAYSELPESNRPKLGPKPSGQPLSQIPFLLPCGLSRIWISISLFVRKVLYR